MKSETTRGAFSPIMLIIETPFEFDAIQLALRIGADGIRASVNNPATISAATDKRGDVAACVDFARSLLDNPEVKR